MNEFYSIAGEGKEPDNEYQLKNFGKEKVFAMFGTTQRNSWGGIEAGPPNTVYTGVTKKDYDKAIANKLVKFDPPYELDKLLDFHLSYYVNEFEGKKERFLNHIEYVVLPIIKERKKGVVAAELVQKWIRQQKAEKPSLTSAPAVSFGNFHGPTQVQVNPVNSPQRQEINVGKEDLHQLLDLLEKDLPGVKDSEIREELEEEIRSTKRYLDKGRDTKNKLRVIGSLMKDSGISVFANLVASPIFEAIKPLLGLI